MSRTKVYKNNQWVYADTNPNSIVTSISSSSTDTEAPSAKCVYDNLKIEVGIATASSSVSTLPQIRKINNVLYLSGDINVTTAIPSSTTSTGLILTLPSGFMLNRNIYIPIFVAGGSSNRCCYLATDGKLYNFSGVNLATGYYYFNSALAMY